MKSNNFLNVILAFFVFGTLEQLPGVMGADVYIVVGPDLRYYPKTIEINVGDTVIWKWAYNTISGVAPHTVTRSISFDRKCQIVPYSQKQSQGIDFDTGINWSGFEFRHTFTKPETVTYHCETTPLNCELGMWGQIIVVLWGARTEQIDLSRYKLRPGLLQFG